MVPNIKLATEKNALKKVRTARLKHKYLLNERDELRKNDTCKGMIKPNIKSDTTRLSTISLTFECI